MNNRPLTILLRVTVVSLYALGTMQLNELLGPTVHPLDPILRGILYVAAFNLAGEGNLMIDRFLNQHMPWYPDVRRRLSVQLTATFVWGILLLFVAFFPWLFLVMKEIPDLRSTLSWLFVFAFGTSLAMSI
jgi:hypothetical protein